MLRLVGMFVVNLTPNSRFFFFFLSQIKLSQHLVTIYSSMCLHRRELF